VAIFFFLLRFFFFCFNVFSLIACQFIFEQAIYYQLSDTALDAQLAKVEVGQAAVSCKNERNEKKNKLFLKNPTLNIIKL
jgi:hypothetical protein